MFSVTVILANRAKLRRGVTPQIGDGAPDDRITADMQVLTPRDNDLDPDIWTGGHDAMSIVYVYMSVNGWSRIQNCEKSISRAIIADGLMTRSSGEGRIRL